MRDDPMTSALQMSKQRSRRKNNGRLKIGVGLVSHDGGNNTGSNR
jgi:hypothetical protein